MCDYCMSGLLISHYNSLKMFAKLSGFFFFFPPKLLSLSKEFLHGFWKTHEHKVAGRFSMMYLYLVMIETFHNILFLCFTLI